MDSSACVVHGMTHFNVTIRLMLIVGFSVFMCSEISGHFLQYYFVA